MGTSFSRSVLSTRSEDPQILLGSEGSAFTPGVATTYLEHLAVSESTTATTYCFSCCTICARWMEIPSIVLKCDDVDSRPLWHSEAL